MEQFQLSFYGYNHYESMLLALYLCIGKKDQFIEKSINFILFSILVFTRWFIIAFIICR